METDKNEVKADQFVEAIAYLLRETFEGSPEGLPSAYLDRGTGLFNTLDTITAEGASREIAGMTIAAAKTVARM